VTLILNDEDVSRALQMGPCINAIEEAYRDLGNGTALSPGRKDCFLASNHPSAYYSFKTIDGGLERLGVYALRVDSDLISYQVVNGVARRVKVPAAQGNRYVGLVYLYSTETLELLAIMNDGHLQRMRVAGTTGVGAKYLARKNSQVLALFGAGWQAETAAWALAEVCSLKAIKIFSPNPQNRRLLAEKLAKNLSCHVAAAGSSEETIKDADIVATATNSQGPVVSGRMIQEGMHLTCITPVEFDEDAWRKSHRIIVSSFHGEYQSYKTRHESLATIRSDQDKREVEKIYGQNYGNKVAVLSGLLLGGVSGRESDKEITLFHKGVGLGIEFAAAAKVVYDQARRLGLGREIPTEWFTQTSHP
jgi:ornithine cyclodeaminase/alanine dehydrogenase-like protein (mu-crystallin family)